jgi:hypothetical protein
LFAKLMVFLIMIIRFYIGSGQYFEEAHCSIEADKNFIRKSYSADFMFAMFHFLLFSVWAMSLEAGVQATFYTMLLWVILLFDLVWYLCCRSYDTKHLMKLWTVFNLATFVSAALVFFALSYFGFTKFTSELAALIPVLIASVIDMIELITGRPLVKAFFANLIRMPTRQPA